MQEGENIGIAENFVGPNYFYFYAEPGSSTITVSYRNARGFARLEQSTLNIELYDEKRTSIVRRSLTSGKESKQLELNGEVKKETKYVIAVIPPSGSLIRIGGDYVVKATGAVKFDKPLTDTELIVGTYSPKRIYDGENTAMKLTADGTLEFASGTKGAWKLFDSNTHLYTLTFGSKRLSCRMFPGRGLVEPNDPSSIVFQRNK
jgi:hypothetical protein